MRLSIRHTTRYRFAAPVGHALQRLHLTPKETQGQQIIEWDMEYENARSEFEYEDQNHNTVTLVSVEPGSRDMAVACSGIVDTADYAGVIGHHSGHLPLWSFLGQSEFTRPGPAMRKLAQEIETLQLDDLELLHMLSARICDLVEYRVGATAVSTTGEQALASSSGVCQDHAHVFIGVARALEIPARYVSGYLMMNDRVHQDATHAWAEAHIDSLGWVGFDISNSISPDQRYVRVATGRDYRDAAPVAGISYGGMNEELEVDVSVEQQQVMQ